MKILGISGLDNSARFKRESNPDLDARELRICQGLDSAAALVVDGEIVAAAAEERFSRKKHTGEFPIGAIQYCLAEGGLSLGDIDCVAHGFDYFPYERLYTLSPDSADLYHRVFSRGALLDAVDRHLPGFPHTRVAAVDHHTAHAASAYLTSGFDECLVVVADGLGEAHGMTVF